MKVWRVLAALGLAALCSRVALAGNGTIVTTLAGSGRLFLTAGIAQKSPDEQAEIMRRVFEFSDFTEDNDPHGEHDFGAFDFAGERIFWKIDCYDQDMKFGSPDAADPMVTTRVLTILLADEY